MNPGDQIKVFVHLARDKDPTIWLRAFQDGSLVGLNDETPYGYGRASHMGCEVDFSRSAPETILAKTCRLAIRAVTGFDLIHAWRNRKAMLASDVIWTHTESQYLAVAALLLYYKKTIRLIGQSVWLFDKWHRLSFVRRLAYSRLIKRVDVLTFHSDLNLLVASRLFPDQNNQLVKFGIPSETSRVPILKPSSKIAVVAVGNDRHRDWKTLIRAVHGRDDIIVTILSGTANKHLVRGSANVTITSAKSNRELELQFHRATLACIPLHDNQHVSGITAIFEAVLAGVPVIATKTGGLETYFSGDEIRYVAPNDSDALRQAILELGSQPERAMAMAVRAQQRIERDRLGAESFVRRHVEISEGMLTERCLADATAVSP